MWEAREIPNILFCLFSDFLVFFFSNLESYNFKPGRNVRVYLFLHETTEAQRGPQGQDWPACQQRSAGPVQCPHTQLGSRAAFSGLVCHSDGLSRTAVIFVSLLWRASFFSVKNKSSSKRCFCKAVSEEEKATWILACQHNPCYGFWGVWFILQEVFLCLHNVIIAYITFFVPFSPSLNWWDFSSCYYILFITFFDLLQKLLGYNYILIFLFISLVMDIKVICYVLLLHNMHIFCIDVSRFFSLFCTTNLYLKIIKHILIVETVNLYKCIE